MPVVTMIAGPNGSGKSTLYRHLKDQTFLGRYFNADDLVVDQRMTGANAQIAVRQMRDDAIKSGIDYCFETVMSHPSHLEHLENAKLAGYRVNLIYVALDDPDVNLGRVKERVASGGHRVPKDRILRRYYRSLNLLADAICIADDARIYDNSDYQNPFIEVARLSDKKLFCGLWGDMPRWFLPAFVAIKANEEV